ncbi:hypothetical protein [Roseixanthobacter liquoris]
MRRSNDLSIADLAGAAALSSGMLSKIEGAAALSSGMLSKIENGQIGAYC